jgi:ATP-binding protein involved in chromosome partitioning
LRGRLSERHFDKKYCIDEKRISESDSRLIREGGLMSKQLVSEAEVRNALKNVQEPELHQDLITLNMVKKIAVTENSVDVNIELTTPACPLKRVIEEDVRQALLALNGIETVRVSFDANVKGDSRIFSQLQIPVKNIIAIASGKGGVGKSTVAANIAIALAQTGAQVGLMDADIYGPNLPQMLGVSRIPPARDNKLVPAEVFGIKLISMGFLVEADQPIIWRGPMLHKAIRELVTDVLWGDLDYLVVDLPPGTGDAQMSLAQSAPLTGGIIVSTPQDVALADARRGLVVFQKLHVPILGIVENMAYFIAPDTGNRYEIFGYGGAERAAAELGVPFLGRLPLDPRARAGGDTGKPVVVEFPDSEIARAFCELAAKIAARISVLGFKSPSKFKIIQ